MTCIVGLVYDGKVYMGADSAASSGWTTRESGTPKLFRKGPYIIGYTTSFRMGQILHHMIDLPEAESEYDESFMVTRFVEAIRVKFKELGFTKIESNQETGGQFLVGVAGKIYEIDSDFQVQINADGMYAIGCGANYALGALYLKRRDSPKTSIELALCSAAYFSNGVSVPFIFMEG